jgi:hypothetical protein
MTVPSQGSNEKTNFLSVRSAPFNGVRKTTFFGEKTDLLKLNVFRLVCSSKSEAFSTR